MYQVHSDRPSSPQRGSACRGRLGHGSVPHVVYPHGPASAEWRSAEFCTNITVTALVWSVGCPWTPAVPVFCYSLVEERAAAARRLAAGRGLGGRAQRARLAGRAAHPGCSSRPAPRAPHFCALRKPDQLIPARRSAP